jgi:SAM-dependent methyltransferase
MPETPMLPFFDRFVRLVRFNLMYLGKPPWDTGITPPELVRFLHDNPPGRALDIGCGTGTNLVALARSGWQVTGIDFAATAVRDARRRLAQEGYLGEVRAGDATSLENVLGQYELVLDIGCYHGISAASRAAYRANLGKILVPGGQYLGYMHWVDANGHGIGVTQEDIDAFNAFLTLEDREDSQDRKGRSASWMRFRQIGLSR